MNSLSVKGRERSLRLKMLPSWQKKLIITTKLQNSKFCKATQHETDTARYQLRAGRIGDWCLLSEPIRSQDL